MSRINDVFTASASDPGPDDRLRLWIDMPTGYFPLPLDDVDGKLERAGEFLRELAPPTDTAEMLDPLLSTLRLLLQGLSDNDTLYCGVGRHRSAVDDSEISSTLVVSLQRTEGTGDPRKLLGEMARRQADAGWTGEAGIHDVLERPVLFCEGVRELPAFWADDTSEAATAPVFSLQALVPQEDGSQLASIELATADVDHGPEYRAMMVTLAASVSFEQPTEPSTNSIRAVLG